MHDEPIPNPGPGEVRLKIMSVGVCASDLHYYRDGRIGTTVIEKPLVIGHEASGVVDAVGEGVTNVRVGDRVAIEPTNPCLECEWCKAGHFNVCPNVKFFGTPPENGCLRDYIVWPAELAIKVPDSMSMDEAAIVEPLAVGVYAAKLATKGDGALFQQQKGLRPLFTVAIMGAGAIGLSALQAVKAMGAERVIVSEPVEERRELAKRLGASEVIDPSACDAVEEFHRLTDGFGPHIVIECTGEDDATLDASRIVRILGRVVVVGIPDAEDYTFEASVSRRKELTVIFCRRSNLAAETAIEWVAGGKVDGACMATHRFPLEQTEEAMKLAMAKSDGVVRAIIAVNSEA